MALNSLGTDSNKQTNLSSNNNNNNKHLSSSSESPEKETNFEYDDNEWDVDGIGDLLIDLDADIAKSSDTTQQQQQQSTALSNNNLSSSSSSSSSSSDLSGSNSPQESSSSSNFGRKNSQSPNTLRQVQNLFQNKSSAFSKLAKLSNSSISTTSSSQSSSSSTSGSSGSTITGKTNILSTVSGKVGGGGGSSSSSSSSVKSSGGIHKNSLQPSALIAQLNSGTKKLNVSEKFVGTSPTKLNSIHNLQSDSEKGNICNIFFYKWLKQLD